MAIGYYILMGYWQCVLACTKSIGAKIFEFWTYYILSVSMYLGVASYCGEVMILALSEITLIVIGEPPSTLCEMRNKLCNTYPSFQLTLPAACRFSVVVPLHLPSLFYLLILQNGPFKLPASLFHDLHIFSYLWEPIFMIQNLASGYTYMYIHTYIHLHLSYMYDQLLLGSTLLYMVRLAQEKT